MALPARKQKTILFSFGSKNALDFHLQQKNQANDAHQRKGYVSEPEESCKRPTTNTSQGGISIFKG